MELRDYSILMSGLHFVFNIAYSELMLHIWNIFINICKTNRTDCFESVVLCTMVGRSDRRIRMLCHLWQEALLMVRQMLYSDWKQEKHRLCFRDCLNISNYFFHIFLSYFSCYFSMSAYYMFISTIVLLYYLYIYMYTQVIISFHISKV